MAKAPSDEQLEMRRRARRRLIGALALVTVIAVVLPWILEHEPQQPEHDVSIHIPSPDSSAFNPQKTPGPSLTPGQSNAPERAAGSGEVLSDPSPSNSGKSAGPDGPDAALKAEQAKVIAPPARPAAKDKPVTAAPESGKKADANAGQFVVQVTALADAEKATGIQMELAAKGLKAYTEKVNTVSGDVTRVRVGPFPNREAAEKERGRLKSLGFEGNVAPR